MEELLEVLLDLAEERGLSRPPGSGTRAQISTPSHLPGGETL